MPITIRINAREVKAWTVERVVFPCHKAFIVNAANVPTGAKKETEFAICSKQIDMYGPTKIRLTCYIESENHPSEIICSLDFFNALFLNCRLNCIRQPHHLEGFH